MQKKQKLLITEFCKAQQVESERTGSDVALYSSEDLRYSTVNLLILFNNFMYYLLSIFCLYI